MSDRSGARRPEIRVVQRNDGAEALVEVSFKLRGSTREAVAAAAAELIDRLQELANRSDCECDVEVSLAWQGGAGTAPGAV